MTEADLSHARSAGTEDGQRLSLLDAVFLLYERRNQPLQIGCIAELDGSIDVEELLEVLTARLVPLRRFRQRPVRSMLDVRAPIWEDDPGFDLRRHVRHVALPAPGDELALRHVVETLFSAPLPPDRPLWEVHLIDGLAGRRSALLCKVHHSVNDGVSGLKVLELMADPTSQMQRSANGRSSAGSDAPDADGAVAAGDTAAPGWLAGLRPVLGGMAASATMLGRAREAAEAIEVLSSFFREPVSELPINGRLGHGRRMIWRSFPLDEFFSIKAALDCTINDVLLSVVAGGLRRYLDERGVCPDEVRVRSVMPVNVRGASQHVALGNMVTAMFPWLPVDVADPIERVERIRRETRALKGRGQGRATGMLLSLLGAVPSAAEAMLFRLLPETSVVNTVCTSMRGPAHVLHLAGRRVMEVHPIVNLFQSIGLGFAAASYAGRMSICASTDPSLVPDGDLVIEAIEESLYETRRALWDRSAALKIATRIAAGPTVEEVMARDVITIGSNDSLGRAGDIMRERQVRHVPVVDERSRVVRVLTQHDLLIGGSTEVEAGSGYGEAADPASGHGGRVACATPHEAAFDAARRMIERQVDVLPVVDDSGRLVGLVTEEHVLRWTTEQIAAARSAPR